MPPLKRKTCWLYSTHPTLPPSLPPLPPSSPPQGPEGSNATSQEKDVLVVLDAVMDTLYGDAVGKIGLLVQRRRTVARLQHVRTLLPSLPPSLPVCFLF